MSNYTVSHCPQLIRQRSTNDCWAAALAMTRWPIGSTTLSSTGQVRELADAAGVRTVMGALPEGDVANMVALARATHSQLIDVRTTPLQLESLARYAAAYSIVIFGHFNYPTQGPATLHAVLLYRIHGSSRTPERVALNFADPYTARTVEYTWENLHDQFMADPHFIMHH
jgi:hypothetical protein